MHIESRQRPGGIQERNPLLHKAVEFAAARVVTDCELHGQENLEILRSKIQEAMHPIILVNHTSMFDAPAIDYALDHNGYRDIADKITSIYGIKIDGDWKTRALSNAFRIIPVWPPNKAPQTGAEREYKKKLNSESPAGIAKALTRGDVIVFFPEATRSRSGKLEEAKPATEPIFEIMEHTLAVPVALQGTNSIMPVEGGIYRGAFSMSVGVPVEMDALKQQYKHLYDPRPSRPYRIAVMTDLMSRVAMMLPEDQRGFYEKLVGEQEELLRAASD